VPHLVNYKKRETAPFKIWQPFNQGFNNQTIWKENNN